MSISGGSKRMSLQMRVRFLIAVFFSCCFSWSLSFGVRLMRAWWSLLMLSFFSWEKESRNSSHSSMMSKSVFGFLPI